MNKLKNNIAMRLMFYFMRNEWLDRDMIRAIRKVRHDMAWKAWQDFASGTCGINEVMMGIDMAAPGATDHTVIRHKDDE